MVKRLTRSKILHLPKITSTESMYIYTGRIYVGAGKMFIQLTEWIYFANFLNIERNIYWSFISDGYPTSWIPVVTLCGEGTCLKEQLRLFASDSWHW
mgnify:CR=1 FL=1